jgi:1-acyl-sn-glycerol-3-phosphate acyltransferase
MRSNGAEAGPQAKDSLKPRYSALAFRGFDMFFKPWRARRLTRTPMAGLPRHLPRDRPLLLVANHTSWWDGFLLRDVHTALRPGAPMYSVMTESELQRLPLLRLLGAVPLRPASAASLRRLLSGLRTATQERPDASVLFFPQGRIWPAWRRPLGFHRGIEVVARAMAPCYILPVALHVESLNRSSPAAFVRVGRVIHVPEQTVTAGMLELAVAEQLDLTANLLAEYGETAAQHLNETMEAI